MNLRAFLAILFAFVISAALFSIRQSSNEKQSAKISFNETKETQIENHEIEESIEHKAYRIGYERGRNAMIHQITSYTEGRKVDYPEIEGKVAKYTVNFEVPDEDKEKIEEIMNKAYVEGYHRAADMFICPRDRENHGKLIPHP